MREWAARTAAVGAQGLRQARSNGRRQACGAISWWMAFGSPRAGRVGAHGRGHLEQRHRDLPQPLDALGRGEEGVIAAHRVVDQPLVGLEHLGLATRLVQRELEAQLVELHARPRPLAVERERELRGVGQVEGEVVRAVGADAGAGREHALGRLAEGDGDDARALGHALARPQVERHTGPAPVVDLATERDEGLGLGVGRHPGLVAVADVLAPHDVAGSTGRIERNTLFFSSLIAPGSSSVGGSMAMNASTWNRWVTTMSR